MKKEKKSILFLVLILVVTIVLILFVFYLIKNNKKDEALESKNIVEIETLSDGTSVNKRENFEKVKTFGNYEISNMVFTSNNNVTTIIADIKNTSSDKLDEKIVTLKLLDNQNREIVSLSGIIKSLEANERTTLNIKSTLNYINAYDYEIK